MGTVYSVGRLPPLPTSVSPDVTEGTTATRSWSTRTGGPYYRLREHRWQEKLAQDPNKNSLENCLDKWVRYIHRAAAPSPIWAGVLGMTLTTRVLSPSSSSIFEVGIPAAMLISSFSRGIRPRRPCLLYTSDAADDLL